MLSGGRKCVHSVPSRREESVLHQCAPGPTAWLRMLDLPGRSCVTLSRLLNLSVPGVSSKIGMMAVSSSEVAVIGIDLSEALRAAPAASLVGSKCSARLLQRHSAGRGGGCYTVRPQEQGKVWGRDSLRRAHTAACARGTSASDPRHHCR